MKPGIYGIKNVVDGKWYVGQSVNVPKRKIAHFTHLRNKNHRNQHLQRAFLKYGMDNFEFHVLEDCAEDMLDIRERGWIEHYKSDRREFGYNLEDGGSFGKHLSEETKRKIGNASKGHRLSEASRRKLSESCNGRRLSSETIRKIADFNQGRRHSEETRRKMSAYHSLEKNRLKMADAHRGKFLSNEHKEKIRIGMNKHFALKSSTNIPGIRVYSEKVVASRG
ncbi:MAG: NUMOD3 domain-containing DNA-binding protein [Candidatus Omnitrophica bacterium]|jgi:group I intron endonuclease|nr:NUMOD3 domain-containing DNA-binding protein [Candidatus Omnitrophota bacterium]